MRESTRFSAAAKAELLTLVATTRQRTGGTALRIVRTLGLSRARYRDWRRRQRDDALADRSTRAPLVDGILLAERDALRPSPLTNLGQARELIGGWVRHYNEERLHGSLGYLPPAEYYRGQPAARQAERQHKLAVARRARRHANTARLTCAA